jgi:hypothetical protein
VTHLIIIFFSVSSVFATENKTVTLGVTQLAYKSPHGKFMESIYTEIFKELGYELKLEILPPVRLALRTKAGEVDGELVRMSSYGEKNPDLTRVEEDIFKFNLFAYSNNQRDRLKLKVGSKLKIGYRKGMKVVEDVLSKYLSTLQPKPFTSMKQVIEQLSAERIDYFIGVEKIFDQQILLHNKINSNKIYKLNRIKSDSAHMFLGKKYSHLASKISLKLNKMKLTGRYLELKKKSLK